MVNFFILSFFEFPVSSFLLCFLKFLLLHSACRLHYQVFCVRPSPVAFIGHCILIHPGVCVFNWWKADYLQAFKELCFDQPGSVKFWLSAVGERFQCLRAPFQRLTVNFSNDTSRWATSRSVGACAAFWWATRDRSWLSPSRLSLPIQSSLHCRTFGLLVRAGEPKLQLGSHAPEIFTLIKASSSLLFLRSIGLQFLYRGSFRQSGWKLCCFVSHHHW